jgi:polysaccharide export outer membrane protein
MRARNPLIRLSVVGALSMTLAACAHDSAELFAGRAEPVAVVPADAGWNAPVVQAAYDASPADVNGPYVLDTGDRLRVFVYGQPNLSRAYTVDQDGRISVPLIGDVEARGRTTDELGNAIRSRLGAEFVRDPQVTVDVLQNRPFFILGEVKAAGQYPYVSGMTVETAVAIAGGYSDRASNRQFRVSRRKNGYVEQFETPSEYPLQPGDTVYVHERFF